MDYNILSLLIVWCLFGISLYFFNKRRYAFIGLIIVIILSALRWDIGNDYENYYHAVTYLASKFRSLNIDDLGNNVAKYEITFQFFIYICSWMKNPIIGVTTLYSIITITSIYLALKRIDGLTYGFFTLFFAGFLFLFWDQMRQGAAIAIFIYSIKYIQNENLKSYLICCLIAFLFHYSAIILPFIYYSKYLKINTFFTITIIFILFIGFYLQIWVKLLPFFFNLTDRYSHFVSSKMNLQQLSSGLGIIAKISIYTIIVLCIKKKHPIVSNVIFIGIIIYLLSCTNEMIERISTYFTSAIILGVPLMMNISKTKLYKQILISLVFIIGTYNAYNGISGCIPYDCVFSDNFQLKHFRHRAYR